MKRKIILIGVAALLVIMFVTIAVGASAKKTPNEFSPLLETSSDGMFWLFSTKGTDWGFNGEDIKPNTIICTWWGAQYELDANGQLILDGDGYPIPVLDGNGNPITYYETITPIMILNEKDAVVLIFAPSSLPDSAITVEGNAVEGYLHNDDHFLASGPGWTWGNVR